MFNLEKPCYNAAHASNIGLRSEKKGNEMMFLVKNGAAVATIETALKEVRASYQSTDDALNAQYPKVLVNAQTYKVSKNKKYAKLELPTACHKAGFRENEFLIIE